MEQKEQKIYIPMCNAKRISDRLLKISFSSAALRDMLNEHTNERGYFNICVSPRREPDKYGNDHAVWVDTWKPDPSKRQQSAPPKAAQSNQTDDDVPF